MMKMLVFDMDGTIADFYGVENWLTYLQEESTVPYETAEPLYNMVELNRILQILKRRGWKICITTWPAKNATRKYARDIARVKKVWLETYDFPYDEFHCIKYGTTKANCTRKQGGFQILIDDNKKVRDGWTLGTTVNAEHDIIPFLTSLI